MESRQPEQGEYLVISVRDDGIGIRAADAKRIFEKFGQVGNVLTDKPQGTGLGLAISGGIVMQHGGALWVESVPDVGSVFSFSVPLAASGAPQTGGPRSALSSAAEDATATVQRSEVAPPKAGRVMAANPQEIVEAIRRTSAGKLIMVVDDEPSIVTALMELLQPHGFRTIGCHSGSEAVARARELAPDAIILDIMMPEINGYDVLRLVKSEPSTAGIPVIVLSVLDDKAKALDLGAAEYVRKPFQKEELLDNVRALA
jgi:CheY-like chemotaxis protein